METSKAYERGYQDYFNGLLESENPYIRGSMAWQSWLDGYYGAMTLAPKEEVE